MKKLCLIGDPIEHSKSPLIQNAMIRAAGLGVAMDNAPDEVKVCADYITADCDRDGVAAAIEKFCF